MKDPVFCHILDSHNLGDMLCGAQGLFPEWADRPEYNYLQLPKGNEPVILGGGGLLHPGLDKWIKDTSKTRPVIPMGIGLNYHTRMPAFSFSRRTIQTALALKFGRYQGIPANWKSFLDDCPIVGLRDKAEALAEPRFRYCPCPTLRLVNWKEIRKAATNRQGMLVIEHYDFPVQGFSQAPRMTNRFTGDGIAVIAEKLSQYECVVTNTYHGALWSLLAGCRVTVFSPFSCRFNTGFPCKLPIIFSESEFWQAEIIWNHPAYVQDVNDALEDAWAHLDSYREEVRRVCAENN
jgi:hypothetical protein